MKSFMNLEDSKWTELIDRLWKKDVTIWSDDENVKKTIANRLGWLDIHLKFESFKKPIFDFLKKLKEKGVTDAVLLGMGGSSLCPYMWSKIFGHLPKYPTFYVLDTTDPSEIKKIESKLNLDTTLFIVASKSGTTIEPNSLYKYFYNLVSKRSKHP
ncbi:MAG: phosphoheptose isomerase, partial [Deltaproteobacteria bacterium]|nr:phosphoheptose isomerase [Deltaproteobacteria bacterium]